MKSFAVLLTLAFLTECLGADRSRQRSPIRSVPVAASAKREVDFDCPEEFGYYPHPTDCTLYYVCVFGGALLESCTGGLMYSHELQTCDWPRNVGCDAAGAAINDDYERLSERRPPPPPPPRRNPPPLPPPSSRAQPNPVITSRGQPKYNRQEYEKQQQLYAEVDDLPPVEEIESDRQQRVYRGQPSTIGQVQKDRDGYHGSQGISSGRTLNSNIIPSSITQNSKIGSFSFGTQVDDRRTATATQAPQTYRGDMYDVLTDSSDITKDFSTGESTIKIINDNSLSRKRREVVGSAANISKIPDEITKKSDNDEEMEYIEFDPESDEEDEEYQEDLLDESERGKRQIRFYFKDGHKIPVKFSNSKPLKFINLQNYNYNPKMHNPRYQSIYNSGVNGDSYNPFLANNNNNQYSVNPNSNYHQIDNYQNQRPFKASLRDPSKLKYPLNIPANQVITKSPPISSLNKNQNPFASLAGGFFNNGLKENSNNNIILQGQVSSTRKPNLVSFPDSSQLSSVVVTGRPVLSSMQSLNVNLHDSKQYKNNTKDQKQMNKNQDSNEDEEYSDEDDDSLESDEANQQKFSSSSFNIPYSFTHPRNKYANIENPFAKPDFDFDEFLAKLRGDQYSVLGVSTQKPKLSQNNAVRIITNIPTHTTPISDTNKKQSIYFKGISTPKPFTMPDEPLNGNVTLYQNIKSSIPNQIQNSQHRQRPQASLNNNGHYFHDSSNNNSRLLHKDVGTHLESLRPNLKPPNFNDDRQLPINYSFNTPTKGSIHPPYSNRQTVTQTPYYSVTKNNNIATLQPNYANSMKPYLVSTSQPMNLYVLGLSQSTPRPPTLANEQLSALQNYWKTPSTGFIFSTPPSMSPNTVTEIAKWTKLYLQALQPSTTVPMNNKNTVATTTAKTPPKRKLIPKPSPEMNDYYYDEEDEQYYYEPAVKSKYMPSSEVMPQRPPMAQNYQEYDDVHEQSPNPSNTKQREKTAIPNRQNNYNPKGVTKNHNDVSVVTKSPYKQSIKNSSVKIPVPVMVDFDSSINSMLHHFRNRTYHIRKPNRPENNPNTLKPPKYLNQTTLRPYTVRHRLAKPTTEKDEDNKQNRGRIRHHNIVAEMKLTTPHDSSKQETRITKTGHDDKTNSLEPTESVIPSSYSPSPRPKMLYNGSQSYSPDQYDPYYAVYDEDGELYKDTDYVQQYNTASLRPAVQQTYRGTPPPPRRPVETYSPRPVADIVDDYDDALIRGPIINQNQYQTPVRQPARGEGNELGYDPIPTSVRTTIYEATFPSTTPTTTSTSTTTTTTTTTTRRPTIAPYTEAITPSRYSPRSSTDENRSRVPASTTNPNLVDETTSSIPSTLSPTINLSSLAKPFEKTDNAHRLHEPSTEITTRRPTTRMTNNNKYSVKLVHQDPDVSNKKMISLTTGFSIRRNINNTQNPYTLTIISKPFDNNTSSAAKNIRVKPNKKHHIHRLYYDVNEEDNITKNKAEKQFQENENGDGNDKYINIISRQKNSHSETTSNSIIMRSSVESSTREPRNRYSTIKTTTADDNKYYLKSILKRPIIELNDSTENSINLQSFLNTKTESPNKDSDYTHLNLSPNNKDQDPIEVDAHNKYNDPIVSPYKTLDNLRNTAQDVFSTERDINSVSTSTVNTDTQDFTSNDPKATTILNKVSGKKPSYYLYQVEDDVENDQTTEVLKSNVKHLIRHFIHDLYTSTPKIVEYTVPSTTSDVNEEVVNIGFQNKKPQFNYQKPSRSSFKHLSIITEPSIVPIVTSTVENITIITDPVKEIKYSSVQTAVPTIAHVTEVAFLDSVAETEFKESLPSIDYEQTTKANTFKSKFSSFINENSKFDQTRSHKFKKIIKSEKTPDSNNQHRLTIDHTEKSNLYEMTKIINQVIDTSTEPQIRLVNDFVNDIASTTSTTKLTTTLKTDFKNKQTTKSLSYPTRASRINPAIKLAAASLGVGRRSYQSSSNCSSDNSLQVNPKCNEIKYQRPTSTRGRGSAHFSTSNGSDAPQQAPNRGTPPTRSRLTLKPSTAIITKTVEKDIYANPPIRPEAVYPQPTPDKTAAKCRKDVCLLPDCFCGGKDIPGNLNVNEVPQIVLLTFDDAVNDLNKIYYEEFFERGRVNPNGCPISSTFYVSHEWTDYSQVQNLYADGHEFASHTISHSFGEQFSQKKWHREVGGQREILAAYGGVKLEDVRGMRAPFLSVGGNKMFKMLYDSNFTYDSSLPVYENRPPSWPYTLDYKLFHDCMIPPCPTKSYPGVWEVPMVMWQDLNGGRCSMGDACANPPDAEGVYKMILKNFDRHYTSNRAPFGLFYHAAWFTQPHHKEGFIMFLDFINKMNDVWIVTNWQALQWVRDPTPISRLNNFQPFQCNYPDRPKKCNNPKVCNLWHKSGVRYMRSCQPCPQIYPWTGKTGISSSRIDKEIEE